LILLFGFSKIDYLNQRFYGGARVLSNSGVINLNIDTAAIPASILATVTQPPSAVLEPMDIFIVMPTKDSELRAAENRTYAPAQPTTAQVQTNATAEPVSSPRPVVLSAPPQSQGHAQEQNQKLVFLRVPPNTYAGQIIMFTAPNGKLVQVEVPPGGYPGQQLQVYY
jgi:hypothetical protein